MTSARRKGEQPLGRMLMIGVPYVWLAIFFLAPFLIVLKISLSDYAIAIPPYTPTIDLSQGLSSVVAAIGKLDFENYVFLATDDLFLVAYLSSLKIAFVSTLITLLIGYPLAYGMARAPKAWRPTLLMLVILPFWTSFLIRVYAWIGILKPEGLITVALQAVGIFGPDEQLRILNTNTAVYIGIVYSYLPFMVLPLYSALEKMDESLLEAASDLGCPPIKAFWLITLPLSLPGVVAGCFLVFIPAVGEFVIPDLLGGSETLMIGKQLWNEFFYNRDWPVSAAVATVLLLILIVPIVLFQQQQQRQQEKNS